MVKEQLLEQFNIYVEKLKKDQPRLYSSLKNKEIAMVSDCQFTVLFQNKAVMDEFISRIKPKMLSFLSKKLNNPKLELLESLAGVDDIKKPTLMNDAERLKNMAEKNPALLTLKSRFNLDFD